MFIEERVEAAAQSSVHMKSTSIHLLPNKWKRKFCLQTFSKLGNKSLANCSQYLSQQSSAFARSDSTFGHFVECRRVITNGFVKIAQGLHSTFVLFKMLSTVVESNNEGV